MTEKDFWNKLRRYLKGKAAAYRIESPTLQGLPDAQVIYEGKVFMFELKVVKGNEKIRIRDTQKAFALTMANANYWHYYILVGRDKRFSYITCAELIRDFSKEWRWEEIEHRAWQIPAIVQFIDTRDYIFNVE